MVLADADFTNDLRAFASSQLFQGLFKVTKEQHKSQKDLEYAVRLIVHSHVDYAGRMDVQDFLSSGIEKIIDQNQQAKTLAVAEWVVETLSRVGGNDALLPAERRVNGIGDKRFSLRALEVIAVGLARNKRAIERRTNVDDFVRERIAAFWMNPVAAELSRAGMRGTARIQKSIPFSETWFKPNGRN